MKWSDRNDGHCDVVLGYYWPSDIMQGGSSASRPCSHQETEATDNEGLLCISLQDMASLVRNSIVFCWVYW